MALMELFMFTLFKDIEFQLQIKVAVYTHDLFLKFHWKTRKSLTRVFLTNSNHASIEPLKLVFSESLHVIAF